jgi:hypothetical protein
MGMIAAITTTTRLGTNTVPSMNIVAIEIPERQLLVVLATSMETVRTRSEVGGAIAAGLRIRRPGLPDPQVLLLPNPRGPEDTKDTKDPRVPQVPRGPRDRQ